MNWRLAIAAIALSTLSGCLKSEDPVPSEPKSYVSILHLAPTAPPLDVYINNDRVSNTPFSPGNITPSYNPIDKGTFSIKFKAASSDSVVAEIPLATYDSLGFYTLFIYNVQANGPANAVRIEDSFSGLDPYKPHYRFFHASPNTGEVDLYLDNVKIESNRSHTDNLSNDQFNEFSGTSGGTHTLQARLAGTDTVLATAYAELVQGNAYTFFLKGLDGGTGNTQLALIVLRAS